MNFLKDIKHIIWDWNGTLLNDTLFCVEIINGILADRSLPLITEEIYRDTFDFPVIEYYERIGFDFEKDPFETLSNEFIATYDRTRHTLKLHEGAIEALSYFTTRRLPQCMLSACQNEALVQMLREQQIEHYFNTVLGLNDHYARGKKHLGNTWLQNNDINKQHVLFVGDTLHDLEVANEMGIHCILISTGHHSKERLATAHTQVVNNLQELLILFKTNRLL